MSFSIFKINLYFQTVHGCKNQSNNLCKFDIYFFFNLSKLLKLCLDYIEIEHN